MQHICVTFTFTKVDMKKPKTMCYCRLANVTAVLVAHAASFPTHEVFAVESSINHHEMSHAILSSVQSRALIQMIRSSCR